MDRKQRAFSPHACFEMRSLIFFGKSAIFLSKATARILFFSAALRLLTANPQTIFAIYTQG
ncbi:MAG: hypothetical protein VB023_06250 [Oscillibacter sp.]|nr:hypothetical protein [Oscillibacter sp.]